MMDEVLLGVSAPVGCEAAVSRCRCSGDPGHAPPHACECGGSWTGEGDTFQVVNWPNDPLASELGLSSEVVGRMLGGVRRGGIRWPIEGDGSDG